MPFLCLSASAPTWVIIHSRIQLERAMRIHLAFLAVQEHTMSARVVGGVDLDPNSRFSWTTFEDDLLRMRRLASCPGNAINHADAHCGS